MTVIPMPRVLPEASSEFAVLHGHILGERKENKVFGCQKVLAAYFLVVQVLGSVTCVRE